MTDKVPPLPPKEHLKFRDAFLDTCFDLGRREFDSALDGYVMAAIHGFTGRAAGAYKAGWILARDEGSIDFSGLDIAVDLPAFLRRQAE
jgi:hypothetical protein